MHAFITKLKTAKIGLIVRLNYERKKERNEQNDYRTRIIGARIKKKKERKMNETKERFFANGILVRSLARRIVTLKNDSRK